MDKRKIVLISVSSICLIAAAVIIAMQFGVFDKGPEPTQVVDVTEELKKDPVMKKHIEQSIKIEEENRAKNRTTTAGS